MQVDKQMLMMFVLLGVLIAVMIVPSFQLRELTRISVQQIEHVDEQLGKHEDRQANRSATNSEKLLAKADKNYNLSLGIAKEIQQEQDERGQQFIEFINVLLADIEEDVDLLMEGANLTARDRHKILDNGTHIIIDNQTAIQIPRFDENNTRINPIFSGNATLQTPS